MGKRVFRLLKYLVRKIIKFVIFMYGFNFIVVGSLFIYFSCDIIIPSFKEANVTILDLFKKEIDTERYDKLVDEMLARSSDEKGIKLPIKDWREN